MTTEQAHEPASAERTPAQLIRDAMDKLIDNMFTNQPVYGPVFGIKTDQSDIFHASKATYEKTLRLQKSLLEQLSAIDASSLTTHERDELGSVLGVLRVQTTAATCYQLEIPCMHMGGAFVSLDDELEAYHTIKMAEDAENLKKRLLRCPERFAEVIERFREGIAKGITLPTESIGLMLTKVSSFVVEDPAESSFNKLFKDKIVAVGLPEDFLLDTIRESVVPAYKAVKEFLETEYKSHARANASIFGLPDYERVYNDLIFYHTSARSTADELHQKGLEEVARIRKRMEAIKDKMFDGTLKEFLVALKDKERFPQLFFANAEEEAVPAYKAMIERIDKKMPQFFNKFPKFPCDVKTVPKAAEASAPVAFYRSGTSEKPGAFFTNILQSKDSPNHTSMALTLHEAIPGHHHERSLAYERPQSHVFLSTIRNTAYTEGWGLYSEFMGEEMGMYDTDFDLLGRLEMEMFRALRLVVDTGLHTKNWTIEQCVEYMQEHLSMSDEEVLSEVKRYTVMPGQALAYKVGEIKIVELRRRAEAALGDKFDIRAFHDVVLDHGAVHLGVLEKNVDEWIASVKVQFPEYFEMRSIMDEYMEANHKQSPEFGPIFGITTFADEIFNYSKEATEAYDAFVQSLFERANAIDASKLTVKERDDLEQLRHSIEKNIVGKNTYHKYIPASHKWGAFVGYDQVLKNYHAIKTAEDAENLKKRLLKFPERFNHVLDCFREGIAKGITLPTESISLIIGRVDACIVEDPAESSFHTSFKDKIVAVGLPEDFLLDTIRESVVPAYKAVKDFLETEYKPHARANPGIFGLPDYERVYNDLIFVHTSARYTADELHQKGLEEVARIRKRMEAIKDKMFDGTLKEFLVALKDKERFPQLYFADDSMIIPHFKAMIERIDKKMPQYFNKFPKFPCDVKPVPKEAESSSAGAYYQSGTADKAGTFYPNFLLLRNAPTHTSMALTLHEAIPGHHHERSLAYERPQSHVFLSTIRNTAYTEGWGLYSEFMGEEMGMYDTDLDLFGRLEAEMFRAVRLVVDTGLHTKNWTIEQCVEYMKDHLTMPEIKIVTEVKRYSVNPGQALAYKVGEIKILEVRKKAESALGDKFDIRAFHDVVLDHGAVALSTLEKNVDEWIATVKA
ncbi:hypothetical protein HK105_200625 [Polyrhizophydium stewartii]|uniref:DUF885 domain-containing protein n=1 Tax=Polyrhizophydium stewartii TaxID=2732419 RepID=A0ABR4NJT2_9FUNG|nr:hypothetical protein HK105_000439 [Polyrhizophydium stewartii]